MEPVYVQLKFNFEPAETTVTAYEEKSRGTRVAVKTFTSTATGRSNQINDLMDLLYPPGPPAT